MKGECDGRELAAGAAASIGAGGIPGHSAGGGAGRMEAGVKAEQDDAPRALRVPGTRGNGTSGFTVAALTKMDDDATDRGRGLALGCRGDAAGSIRVPSLRAESREGGPGGGGSGGDGEDGPAGIRVPTLHREAWDPLCLTGTGRPGQDVASGSPLVLGAGQGRASGTRTFGVTLTESHAAGGVGAVPSGGVPGDGGGSEEGVAVAPGIPVGKRASWDAVPLQEEGEGSVKRLKTEGTAGASGVAEGQGGPEHAAARTRSLDTAAGERVSLDGPAALPGTADIQRPRQDGPEATAGTTAPPAREQRGGPATRNAGHLQAARQGTAAGPGCAGPYGAQQQDGALPVVGAGRVSTENRGTATEALPAQTVRGRERDEAPRPVEPAGGVGSEGHAVRSPPSAGACRGTAGTGHPDTAGPEGQTPAPGSPTAAGTETSVHGGQNGGTRDSGVPVPAVKEESQGKAEGQGTGTGTDRPAVSRQCPEEDGDVKREAKTEGEEKETSLGCPGGEEGKVQACGPADPARPKPEMVSIETQCDGDDTFGRDEDAFPGEDAGLPGECLGGCEPGKKPHKCCQCDTSFRTPYELSRHGRVHTGERPYQCRLCHRCFKRKDHVEVHTRRHAEDRRHACGECGACFVTSSCLLRHRRRTHQAPGTRQPGEGEGGEGEGEAGEGKGESKEQPSSRDGQKNGRRNKKNKPDTTYRPGGKTVCIIKKRNLRQRSYSFVELEDDVECFESDEEDRIPFLKVQEQRREEEHEELGGQSGQLEHSLFPASLFNPEASLGQLLLLGEVSRLLTHSLLPGAPEAPALPAAVAAQLGRAWGPPQDPDGDSDDSDYDPPLVACDVTFMEGEGEVTGILPPDDGPSGSRPEATAKAERDGTAAKGGPPRAVGKTTPAQPPHKAGSCQKAAGPRQGHTHTHLPLAKGGTCTAQQPGSRGSCLPPAPGKPAAPQAANGKGRGTVVGAMGEPRTAWVVPANNSKGKNTCDACRRRNEANRLAQAERERQAQTTRTAPKREPDAKPEDPPKGCQTGGTAKMTAPPPPKMPPPKAPAAAPPPNKRSRKSGGAKKRRPGKGGGEGNGAAVPQRPHKCHLCPFNFRSATELKRHASTHSGERPFLCELCGAGFMRKCHLQLHVRRHSGERRHACPECRMRFFTPSDLARHQAIHQAGDKPLECHLCHLTFRRAFHLERHIRRHSEAAPFACKLCGAFFSSAAALRSHDKHHRTPAPHACPDCTAAFTTATALSRHRRVHSARHHRLLRAIERHATAKSSYECVSSEGSPLSLVIRKVSAAAGTPGEAGARPARDVPDESPSPAGRGKEKREEQHAERDTITSGLCTADGETDGTLEGRGDAPSTLPPGKEGDEAASGLSTADDDATEGLGSEGSPRGPSGTGKATDGESITSGPSVPDEAKDGRETTACTLPGAGGEQADGGTRVLASTTDQTDRGITSAAAGGKEREGREAVAALPAMTEKLRGRKAKARQKTLPTLPLVSREAVVEEEEEVNSSSSSSHGREKSAAARGSPSVFGCFAAAGQDGSGAINLSAPRHGKAGKDEAKHKELPAFPHVNSREAGSTDISREAEAAQEPASRNGCSTLKELHGNSSPHLAPPPTSKERKEAQGKSAYGLLLPTNRDVEAVKEEIHCRTAYRLAAPGGGQEEALHAPPGYPQEQEGGRGSTEEGGQQAGAREGVTTTS